MHEQQVSRAYKTNNDNVFIKYIGLIASIGAAVSVLLLLLRMISMEIYFASGPLLAFVIIDIGLVAFSFFMVLSNKINRNNIIRFVCIALSVLILFINLFVESYVSAADDFLGGIGFKSGSGTIEYSVIAQRTAGIQLTPQNSVRAGIQNDDDLRAEAEKETSRLAQATFTEYENVSEMIHATETLDLDVGVVQSAILEAYAEYFPDDYNNIDVLATFKVGSSASTSNENGIKIDITKPFAVFISGLDDFGDIDSVKARSDVNMLVLIDPERYKMLLISTPRDYYVQLHGTKGSRDKLSHAGIYGIDMSKNTIEDLYGVTADYKALINFNTIVEVVDSMGGIVVSNPRTFELWGQTYKEGDIWLNGDMALLFSRARKDLANGDIDRAANQQIVIQGMMDRLTEPQVVIHYKTILDSMKKYFRSNIPPEVITQLFSRQISLGGDWTIEKMVADGAGDMRPTYSMGGTELSVIIPNEQSLSEIRTAISNFMNRVD